MMKFLSAVAIACAFATVPAHAATMIGATVNVSARYPDTATVYANGGNKVVSDAVEYGTGSFAGYNSGFSVDVQADRIVISFNGFTNFGTANFNGFVLRVISGPALTGATIDAASTFSPISATVSNGDLLLNYSGVQGLSGTSTSIVRFDGFSANATAAVPEPATWAMMIIGFGLVGGAMRRRSTKIAFA